MDRKGIRPRVAVAPEPAARRHDFWGCEARAFLVQCVLGLAAPPGKGGVAVTVSRLLSRSGAHCGRCSPPAPTRSRSPVSPAREGRDATPPTARRQRATTACRPTSAVEHHAGAGLPVPDTLGAFTEFIARYCDDGRGRSPEHDRQHDDQHDVVVVDHVHGQQSDRRAAEDRHRYAARSARSRRHRQRGQQHDHARRGHRQASMP